jgi:3',5'-cyclic AMP phosphodiesterase CpdA
MAAAAALALWAASCIDVGGFIVSSDVDERFEESRSLPATPSIAFSDTKFSFIVMSDLHIYNGGSDTAAAIKDRIVDSDRFILVAGDISQEGSTADLTMFKSYMSHTGLPFYPSPGNHDLYYSGWDNYKAVLGRDCYSVTAGPVRIIAFDSANGTLGPKQKDWLENELKSSTEALKFVFTHFNFFSPHPWELQQYTDIREVYYLLDLFGDYKVSYTFTGHSHYFDYHEVRGVKHLTMPAFKNDASFIRVYVDGTDMSFERVRP